MKLLYSIWRMRRSARQIALWRASIQIAILVVLITTLPSVDLPGFAMVAQAQVATTDLPLPDEALLTDPIFARPGYGGLSQAWLRRTRYLLAIDIDRARGRLVGKARILYVNNAPVPVDRIVLRLYQNHPWNRAEGRRMAINRVLVDGQPVIGQTADSGGTVYRVPLAQMIPQGGTATLDVDYQITIPQSAFYFVSEPYPIVAPYSIDTGWREDVSTKGLDYTFTETALIAANLRAPTDVLTWFIGASKTITPGSDGTTTYTLVTGPVRNFVIAQAKGWRVLTVEGGPVPVRVVYQSNQVVAQEIGGIAAQVMNFFDARIATYPYAELGIVAMRYPSGGKEYPSLVFINHERDAVYRRFITAHEVAHQWFYGIAGNDTLRNAWLGESLVQVSGYLFYKLTGFGGASAPEDYWASILRWYNRLQTPKPLNTPVEQFTDFNDYMANTYGGGAVFFRGLSEQIGDLNFLNGLSAYVQSIYLGVGSPLQFFSAIQAQTPLNLSPQFCQRIGIMC